MSPTYSGSEFVCELDRDPVDLLPLPPAKELGACGFPAGNLGRESVDVRQPFTDLALVGHDGVQFPFQHRVDVEHDIGTERPG